VPEPTTHLAQETGSVIEVIDGSTILVQLEGTNVRVRYLGVEVPRDAVISGTPAQEQATRFNRFLVGARQVRLTADNPNTDGQGSLLRYVYVDGELVNETLIANGYARVSGDTGPFALQTRLIQAEQQARDAGRGIWMTTSVPTASPPEASPTPVPSPGGSRGTLPPLPQSD
jgi:micrococcal nuclease